MKSDDTDLKASPSGPELTPMSGHSYDGIEELDNSLPRWWLNLFYITIVFGAGYFGWYVLGSGPTLVQEYKQEKREQELALLSRPAGARTATEEELRLLLKDPSRIAAGKAVFQSKCVSCHASQGQGGIGPNLTDDHWIHGGKMTEIAQTITAGVLDKGMPPWGTMLKLDEIHSVVAYVKSLRGSNPPGAKPPQGELVKE